MQVLKQATNERLDALKMGNVAREINAVSAKRLAELLKEIEEMLKVVEAKKTLHIRLTQEERAAWILFGRKEKKE